MKHRWKQKVRVIMRNMADIEEAKINWVPRDEWIKREQPDKITKPHRKLKEEVKE